jgi:hypothetical protein
MPSGEYGSPYDRPSPSVDREGKDFRDRRHRASPGILPVTRMCDGRHSMGAASEDKKSAKQRRMY